MHLSNQSLLVIIIVGIVAGWLAGRVMEGGGFGLIGDLLVGLVGAFVGDWLLPRLGIHLGVGIVGLHKRVHRSRGPPLDPQVTQWWVWTQTPLALIGREHSGLVFNLAFSWPPLLAPPSLGDSFPASSLLASILSSGRKPTILKIGYLKDANLIWPSNVKRPAVDGHLEARDGGAALGADWR